MFKKNWFLFVIVQSFGILGFAIFLYAFLRTHPQLPNTALTIALVGFLFGAFIFIAGKTYSVKISPEKISIFEWGRYQNIFWEKCSKDILISSPRTIILTCENKKYSVNLMVFKDPDLVLDWIQKQLYTKGK